jgi:hypothetical protein
VQHLARSEVVLCLILFGAGMGTPAGARSFEVAVEPGLATWRDPMTLEISGIACAPSIAEPRFEAGTKSIDLDLSDSCEANPAAPFSRRVGLGRLAPGRYTVTIHDLSQGGVGLTSFLVYSVNHFDVVLPPVATDAEPTSIEIGDYGTCRFVDVGVDVDTKVITVVFIDSCGIFPTYVDPTVRYMPVDLGLLPAGTYDLRVNSSSTTLRVWDADGCVPSDTTLCLHDGRFAVTARWRAFDGTSGAGHAAPLAGNEETGLLWFFGPDNSELTVKVLAGCPVNQRWWTFVSGSSTVEYDVEVTDTRTGARHGDHNPLGHQPSLAANTDAFVCP